MAIWRPHWLLACSQSLDAFTVPSPPPHRHRLPCPARDGAPCTASHTERVLCRCSLRRASQARLARPGLRKLLARARGLMAAAAVAVRGQRGDARQPKIEDGLWPASCGRTVGSTVFEDGGFVAPLGRATSTGSGGDFAWLSAALGACVSVVRALSVHLSTGYICVSTWCRFWAKRPKRATGAAATQHLGERWLGERGPWRRPRVWGSCRARPAVPGSAVCGALLAVAQSTPRTAIAA